MKIFDREGKINFVDENNVFLGYDMGQCCCERADWYISDIETYGVRDRDPKESEGLGGWIFDTKYFKKVDCNDLDEGEMVRFRIFKGAEEKFIHLFNCHNGYYGHGFEFMVGDEKRLEGCL